MIWRLEFRRVLFRSPVHDEALLRIQWAPLLEDGVRNADLAYVMHRSRLAQQAGEFDAAAQAQRSEEHTSELQSPDHLVCRLLLEKKKDITTTRLHRTS